MVRRRSLAAWLSGGFVAGSALLPVAAHAAGLAQPTPVPLFEQFLALLANPNVAYFLFVLGLLGLVGELVVPGAVFPGAAGAICLLLGLVGFGQLPTNWGGAALIAVALALFVFDLHVPGHGLSVGGVIAFLLGSLLIFTPFWAVRPVEVPEAVLSPWLILLTTSGLAALFVFGAAAGLRAQLAPVAMGRETLLGKVGTVRRALAPEGIVHLDGEEWTAVAADATPIPAGAEVRVVQMDGLRLTVEPVTGGQRGLGAHPS